MGAYVMSLPMVRKKISKGLQHVIVFGSTDRRVSSEVTKFPHKLDEMYFQQLSCTRRIMPIYAVKTCL